MVVLVSLLESFSALAAVQIADRESAAMERNLRSDQEREFEEALAADQEVARLQESEEAQRAEEEAQRDLEEAIRLSKEAEEEAQVQRKRSRIAEEPEAGPGVAKVLFVMPAGGRVTRRFRHEDTVEVLRDFIGAQLYEEGVREEFQLETQYPKATLTEGEKTVKEAGLTPSAQVLVTLAREDPGSSDESDEE